ncbi:MAG: hypothetical protein U0235_10890 [Polyangiaceae bacterium]
MARSSKRGRAPFGLGLGALIVAAACGGRVFDDAPFADAGPPDAGRSREAGVSDAAAEASPRDAGAPDVALPPETAVVTELGAHASNVPFTFVIPPNTLGFQVLAGSSKDATVRIESLVGPGDAGALFTAGEPRGSGHVTAEGTEWVAAAIPMPEVYMDSPVAPGPWTVKVSSTAGSVRVTLTVQPTSDGRFHGGALDLHVYVPKGLVLSDPDAVHTVDPTNAASDAALSLRIDTFFDALETYLGVGRGNVTYHQADARFAALDTETLLAEAFESTAVVPDRQALHVFFTNSINIDGTNSIWGISPGLPGAARKTGTSLSGIAVSQIMGSPAEADAFTMLHEAGHFFGLSHTTEIAVPGSGTAHDPLSDTPVCDGGVTDLNLDTCPDHTNLMYPTGLFGEPGAPAPVVSDHQRRVFWGSPSYRAFATGTPPKRLLPLRRPVDPRRAPFVLPPNVKRCVIWRR